MDATSSGTPGAMSISSFVARPLLAGMFVYGGVDAFRNPAGQGPKGEKGAPDLAPPVGDAPALGGAAAAPERVGKTKGRGRTGAGTPPALGIFPPLSALLPAGSLVP